MPKWIAHAEPGGVNCTILNSAPPSKIGVKPPPDVAVKTFGAVHIRNRNDYHLQPHVATSLQTAVHVELLMNPCMENGAVLRHTQGTDTMVQYQPPQANDAKCGAGCHTLVKTRDYVFTEYGKR